MKGLRGDGDLKIILEHRPVAGEVHGEEFDEFIAFWSEARDKLNREIIFRKM